VASQGDTAVTEGVAPAGALPGGHVAPSIFGDRSTRLQLGLGVLLVVTSVVMPSVTGSEYWSHNFLLVNLYVTVAILQNMLLSDAGQVSFGQGAVFGLAAYTTGIVAGLWGQPFWIGASAGIGAGLVLGLLFALPALRVQSYYLGFVTLAAAVVFPDLLVAFNTTTNGINGIQRQVPELATPLFAGLSWNSFLIMAVTAGALIAHVFFRRSSLGRQMRIAAKSPEAAMTLGLSPGRLRFIAFIIAGIGTGIAGVLYVPVVGFVSPYAFRVELSIYFFFAVIVGGSGRLLGPVVGAWILYLVPNALLVDLSNYRLLGYGIVALLIMLLFPDGVVGSIEKTLRRMHRRTQTPALSMELLYRDAARATPPAPAGDRATPAVEVTAARKVYGMLPALDGVNVTIERGTIHGLVGPNGSGKTTLLNVISGLIRLDSGRVRIDGNDTTRLSAHRTARLGVARTFQTPHIFDDMSVWDNLKIGADFKKAGESWLLDVLADRQGEWQEASPDLLPHAQRRLLEVMRVVAMDARILLLDEPAAGLSSEERKSLVLLLRFLRDRLHNTIVFVEHDLNLVWRVADRISVLDAGALVADGAPDAIVANPRVRALFTGKQDA
jgi:branched-chain amino acid transport system permease protein